MISLIKPILDTPKQKAFEWKARREANGTAQPWQEAQFFTCPKCQRRATRARRTDCGGSPFSGAPPMRRFADVAPEQARFTVASMPGMAVSWISASRERWQKLPGRFVSGS